MAGVTRDWSEASRVTVHAEFHRGGLFLDNGITLSQGSVTFLAGNFGLDMGLMREKHVIRDGRRRSAAILLAG